MLLTTAIWIAALFAAMSVITYIAYAVDKSRAKRAGARRIPEATLLLLGFLCGWPGAIAAQQRLRHKTVKREFRVRFWFTVIGNVIAVALIVWLLLGR